MDPGIDRHRPHLELPSPWVLQRCSALPPPISVLLPPLPATAPLLGCVATAIKSLLERFVVAELV